MVRPGLFLIPGPQPLANHQCLRTAQDISVLTTPSSLSKHLPRPKSSAVSNKWHYFSDDANYVRDGIYDVLDLCNIFQRIVKS